VGHRAGEVAVEPEEVPGAGAGTEDGGR